ncbi:MAG TPA: DUF5658 family protein [Vicinamibacterales bacterium]|nr:DUF5658 family protein [Vicinamibacterales bacterium]
MASAPVAISGFARPAFLKRWRPSGAQVLWMAFVIVQALDGVMSYVGVSLHGPGIEANPLVGWYLSAFGPAVGFTMAKLFAVTCGSVLYFTARYQWVAILTLVYLIFAVAPWVGLLSNSV